MALKRRGLRYAHASGHTDLCYAFDGCHVITCGRDGDIRFWLSVDDDDPTSTCAGEWSLSVQCLFTEDDKRVFVSTDNHSIQVLSFPKGERDGIIARFTAPVSHLAVDHTSKILAGAGQDMTVQILSVADKNANLLHTFTDISGPVLSVALSPGGKFLAASSGDGSLRIWDVKTKELLKQIECVPYVNSFPDASVVCRVSFEPNNGQYLAYPDMAEVILLNLATWEPDGTFTAPEIQESFSIVSYSTCGKYLAASTIRGSICVWHVGSRKLLGSIPHPKRSNVTALAWNPKGNGEIGFCDLLGQMGVVDCDISSALECNDKEGKEDKTITSSHMNYSDDEDDENVISLEKLKSAVISGDLNDDLLMNDEPSRPSSRISSIAPKCFNNLQPPFQPSSSPGHLKERYLLWNKVGIVRSYAGEDDDKNPAFVDINFHDLNVHHGMHIRNILKHSMAGLSSTVLALACETPSKLVCVALSGGKEWQVDLPDGEEILCLTASENLVAIATDVRFLRIFTAHGNQRDVISIPGPVVAVASHRYSILVAFHSYQGVGADQNISLLLLHLEGMRFISGEIRCPLSPGATLSWIGYTTTGIPATYDSSGILRIFSPSSSVWFPVYDHSINKKGISDDLFIITVNPTTQIIDAISCKGSRYPPIAPRPLVGEFAFLSPMCEKESEKSQLEDVFVRTTRFTKETSTKTILETAMKLFSLACRNEFDQRALEITESMMDYPKFTNLAWKYAVKRGRTHLVEKINELLENFSESENLENDENLISKINENRMESFSSLVAAPVRTREPINDSLRPLVIKRDENMRVKVCKVSKDEQQIENESVETVENSMVETETPPSITEKSKRNPFSKNRFGAKKITNPFNTAGTTSTMTEEKNTNKGFGADRFNKRKQPDSVQPETVINKQSKLSQFICSKRTEDS